MPLVVILIGLSLAITQCTDLSALDEDLATRNESEELAIQSAELTDDEVSGILFMREEEKLARDVYLYLYEIYPLRPFLNISKSEQAHMDAIKYLIDTYELEDPVGENPPGVFQNKDLQLLYNELIEQGAAGRAEALQVGALIEEVDIIDLQTELEEHATHEDVVRVYGNLCSASENHLRAFVRVLRLYDVEYQPEKLDQASFDRIMEE